MFLFVVMLCTFLSCNNEKAELITQFQQLYASPFEDYHIELDKSSSTYYKLLSTKNNLNIDSMVNIGLRYDLPYLTTTYLASCGNYIKESNSPSDFFYFLYANELSFFNKDRAYQVLPDKSRIQDDGWIAIYRKSGKAKVVSYVKYTNENGIYKYNLLHNLSILEGRLKVYYSQFKTVNSDLSELEYFKAVYSTYGNNDCSIEYFKNKATPPY